MSLVCHGFPGIVHHIHILPTPPTCPHRGAITTAVEYLVLETAFAVLLILSPAVRTLLRADVISDLASPRPDLERTLLRADVTSGDASDMSVQAPTTYGST